MYIFYLFPAILLGILIIVHEIGHFFAARISGVRVERFSIGFGPRIASFVRGDTEYAISLIPLGGYVKMAGAEHVTDPTGAEPWTFVAKPIELRMFIVAAGQLMNFVWAVIVTTLVLMIAGSPTLGDPIIADVLPGSVGEQAGLVGGDLIVAVDDAEVGTWAEVYDALAGAEEEFTFGVVSKDSGERREVHVQLAVSDDPNGDPVVLGITPYIPSVIGGVMRGSPADRAGLRSGDRVVSVSGIAVSTWYELGDLIHERPLEETEVVWERDGVSMRAVIVPEEGEDQVNSETRKIGLIGIMRPWDTERLGPWHALTTGFAISVSTLSQIGQFIWGVVTRQVSSGQLGGPVRVVQMASESARWGGSYFFTFMAFLSLNLGFINLLPLPILDGGHLLLLLLEKLRRRTLTERQLLIWQQAGFAFFAVLMVFLLVRDLIGLR
jgi:regulator of sigma E protease